MHKKIGVETVESTNKSNEFLKKIKTRHILIPIVLGLAVVFVMFWNELQTLQFSDISLSKYGIWWLVVSFILMLLRDVGYIIRLKVLSEGDLSWKQCLRIVILWEFTSTITPSAVGGTSVAIFFMYKEKVPLGKSTAIVMITAFLDEMYFLIMFPLLLLLIDFDTLFSVSSTLTVADHSIFNDFIYFAIIGYGLKALFVVLLAYGLFVNPRGFMRLLGTIFSVKFLKRWRRKAFGVGKDIMHASIEYKQKSFLFWVKVFSATFLSWTSRYWVINTLFLAFFVVPDHMLLFARQLIMWIMMLVMPTPGGSGFAEFVFVEYLGEFIPIAILIPILAILWRVVTYYPYLIVGAIYVPMWLKKLVNKE